MAEDVPQDSLASFWAQLAVLGLLACFIAMFPGGLAGAAVCGRIQEEYRAAHGVTPDGLGCAVPGAVSWALSAAAIFALAVWWGSGRGFPSARLLLGRSMLGVVSVWFIAPALILLVVAAQPDTADRDWMFGVGASYSVATLCAGIGALRGGALVAPAAAAATVFGLSPILLYPVHEVFGVLITTVLTAPALGLALAAALSTFGTARDRRS